MYRRIDDAFPLQLVERKSSAEADLKRIIGATLKGETSTTASSILFGLDEANHSLTVSFRAVYVVYQSDPCGNSEYFAREMQRIVTEQQRLTDLKLKLSAVVAVASARPEADTAVAFGELLESVGLGVALESTRESIRQNRQAAIEWKHPPE